MSAPTAPVALEVDGLSKVFRVYDHPADILRGLVSRAPKHRDVVALDNVSLVARTGETVGLVGRNGAGKTTLLSIVAGTVSPTSGRVSVRGRIGAILELGTGFHPGFTGRENVYMGGLCMGLTRRETEARFEWIVEFSELADVIDQPLFTYSTGMKARLFFSTALSVDPDVLIVDEALSVGDARFQVKSFRRFQELKERGVTILLVSHNANTVTSFCDRAIILENGRVYGDGDPNQMMQIYHRLLFGEREREATDGGAADTIDVTAEAPPIDEPRGEHRYGSGEVEIADVALLDGNGRRISLLQSGERYVATLTVKAHETVEDVSIGFLVSSDQGVSLFGLDSASGRSEPMIPGMVKGQEIRVTVDFAAWLGPGTYFVTVAAARSFDQHKYDCRHDAIEFKVVADSAVWPVSSVNLDARFHVESAGMPPAEAGARVRSHARTR